MSDISSNVLVKIPTRIGAGELADPYVRIIGSPDAQRKLLQVDYNRSDRAKVWRIRWHGPKDAVEKTLAQISGSCTVYNMVYGHGSATLIASFLQRIRDVVTWESTPFEKQADIRQHAYYAGVAVGEVDQKKQKGELYNSAGVIYAFGDSKQNDYRDDLLAGKTTYLVFGQTLRKTTITANASTTAATYADVGTIDDPNPPSGIPMDTGFVYLKKSPTVSFDGSTYQIVEEWVSGDWDTRFYT